MDPRPPHESSPSQEDLPKASQTLGELVRVVAGKLVALGSLFACGVLVARGAGPIEYGLYSAALSLALLLDGALGFPFDIAAVRFGSEGNGAPERRSRMLRAIFYAKLGVGVAVCAALAVVAGPLASWLFSETGHGDLLLATLAGALGLLALRGVAAVLQAQLRFPEYARLDALHGIARLLGVGALFAVGIASAPAYVGALAGAALAVMLLSLVLTPQLLRRPERPDPVDLRRLVSFAGITAATTVLGNVTARSDVLILSVQSEAAQVGYYAAALQVASLLTLLASYAGAALQPRVVPAARQGQLSRLLGWSLAAGAGAGLLAAGLGVALAPVAVGLLFGDAYAPAIPLLRILIVGAALDWLGLPLLVGLVMQLFPRRVLWAELVSTLVFLALVPGLAAAYGATGVALCQVGMKALKLAFYLGVATRGLARRSAEDLRIG